MKRRTYDFAFGLGIVCSCSETLRAAGLQFLSFPYDWITIATDEPQAVDHDVICRAEQICDEFSTWFQPGDFTFKKHLPEIGKDQYVNTRLNLIFNHDFLSSIPFEQALPDVTKKYQRRCRRLIEGIRAAKRVLLLHVDRPDKPSERLSTETAQRVRTMLADHFKGTTFDFFLFSYEKGRAFADRQTERIDNGLTRVTFDYRDYSPGKQPHQVNLHLTGDLLANEVRVRDYRTCAEKRKFHEQKWAKRCKTAGVADRRAFLMAQLRGVLRRCYDLTLAALVARLKRKTFDQIVILGFNCEAAFRFVCKWDFLDSSLLAWANSLTLDNLIRSLGNFDGIGTGEMTFHVPSQMWRCSNSGIYFHGKLHASDPTKTTQAERDADLDDLRARLAHLKEKFRTYATNGKPTLFVYKLTSDDQLRADLGERLDALEAALRTLGANNAHLLVICEHRRLSSMPAGLNRSFRSVLRFNPGNDVTNRRKGDPSGWNRIYSEFAPAVVHKRAHKFKYE